MSTSADFSEARAFAADLARAAFEALPAVRAVVQKGALNIKTQMQREMGASRHFAPTARSISYDTTIGPGGVEAEIGPDKGRRGSLANLAYFGASRGGGGTVPDPQGALEAEAPAVESYILDAIERSLS